MDQALTAQFIESVPTLLVMAWLFLQLYKMFSKAKELEDKVVFDIITLFSNSVDTVVDKAVVILDKYFEHQKDREDKVLTELREIKEIVSKLAP